MITDHGMVTYCKPNITCTYKEKVYCMPVDNDVLTYTYCLENLALTKGIRYKRTY